MKLLVVSSWFPYPPDNGSKLRAYALLTQLAKRHSITLLSFAERGEEQGVTELAGICRTVQTIAGNPFKATRKLALRYFLAQAPRSLAQAYSPAMQRLVDVHAGEHDAALALQTGAAAYLMRHDHLPRILEEVEVGIIRDQYERAPTWLLRARHGSTWWKLARYTRTLVDTFECTTVVSDVERSHLGAAGCDLRRVQVVPNGVDGAYLALNHEPIPARMIYPGSITYSANLDAVRFFLADVYPRIRARRPDVTFDITGDTGGADLGRLGHGSAGVTFTGRVPDITRRIAKSTVCVVPLRVGGGTRLKVLESMAMGTPVVATSKGIEGLDLTPERDVLVGDTPDELMRQVIRVLDDPVLRARLASAGRQLVGSRYTWEGIGAQLDTLLDDIVGRAKLHAPRRRVGRERYRVAD